MAAPTLQAAIDELDRSGSVRVGSRRGGLLLAVLGALLFTAVSAWLLAGFFVEPSWWAVPRLLAGGVGVLFFGIIGVPTLLWRWATAQRSITVTTQGLALAGGSRIAWQHVRSAKLATVFGQRFAVLLPRDEPDAQAGLTPLARLLARWNGWLLREASPIALPAQVELAPDALLQLVQHARRRGGHLPPLPDRR